MAEFAWGVAVGYGLAMVRDVWTVWRDAKVKVNEARRGHGLEPEKRWWRL